MNYAINEKFFTLSGEAPNMGMPIFLIRFSGCNLNCSYCDTTYHKEINENLSHEELHRLVAGATTEYSGVSVLFTGGEPLLGERAHGLAKIIASLPYVSFFVETNGTVLLPILEAPNVSYVVDWKAPSSLMEQQFNKQILGQLRENLDCVKIVVAKEDLPFAVERINEIHKKKPRLKIFLSPQWGMSNQELAEFIIQQRLNVNLSVQLHKIIWGERRGV